jgi:hypothetical protein
MAKLYWHRPTGVNAHKAYVFSEISEGVGVNPKRLQKMECFMIDYYSFRQLNVF